MDGTNAKPNGKYLRNVWLHWK